ncbi:MAG: GGDEF domain-containing protein [Acholeplasmatales bacterium]|nr:GGDEF domain-containing protein [Acholeplasmatales bacterium]
MYLEKDLYAYDVFKDKKIEYLLDPLTGILTRGSFEELVNELIKKKIVFTLCMADVDNFKLVNDNFGHHIGDECLKEFADRLVKAVGSDGICGRFGGDEFIFVVFGEGTYDSAYERISKLYKETDVVRSTYNLNNVNIFITATIGCASFPKDATEYNELFLRTDKALYRGKTKGRNCYIIYVHEKHKDIDVQMKENSTIYGSLMSIDNQMNDNLNLHDRIKKFTKTLVKMLDITNAVIINKDLEEINYLNDNVVKVTESDIKEIEYYFGQDLIIHPSSLREYKDNSKYFLRTLGMARVQAMCGIKIMNGKEFYGYIFLHEERLARIWQDKDFSLMLFIGKLLIISTLNNK